MQDDIIEDEGVVAAFNRWPVGTKIALGTFIIAKMCSICAIPAIYVVRPLARNLLIAAGVCILISIIGCSYDLYHMRKRNNRNKDLEAIKRLMKSGQLESLIASVKQSS